jgi:heterodisulfide reductase subunit A-like polyferredoxin/coenzyme F420-reducing hydrogenase delta subunit
MTMAAEEKSIEKIGVVLCTCATTLARRLDFEHLKKVAAAEPGVAAVEQFAALCGKDAPALAERLQALAPQAVVAVGCSEELMEPQMKAILAQAGLRQTSLSVANLKEQCRGLTGALATAKASAVMRQAIARARLLRPPEERPVEVTAAALVIGGGWTGLKAAQELIAAGFKVAVVEQAEEIGNPARQHTLSPEEQSELSAVLTAVRASEMPVLTNCELVSCRGVVGGFEVRLNQDGQAVEGTVGAVVVSPCQELVAPFEAYGLKPGESVVSASQLEETLSQPKARAKLLGRAGLKVAFLLGLAGREASPAALERTLRSALAIARDGAQARVFLISGELRVAAQGLEALSLSARQAGIIFFKLSDAKPRLEQSDGAVKLTLFDEILTEEVEIDPDLVVVAEDWRPSSWLPEVADRLGLAMGPAGFAQPDNVHLFPVESNREGVFVIGPARRELGLRDNWAEAVVAAGRVKALLGGPMVRPVRATVDRGKCTICLTCARFCPHGAIGWDNRAIVMPAACQGCGICAAECPMEAIQLVESSDAQVEAQLAAWESGTQVLRPRLVGFCCQRSAYQAMGLAVELGHTLPPGLQVVRVPCAGKVDVDYILKAFETGADGVMVMGCHEDNCRSLRGNTYAQWRVEAAQRLLADVGLEPERVAFANIASNMGSEFARLVNQMEERLKGLRVSPVIGVEVAEVRAEARRASALDS